ncbi:MAG TPA: hypothetical protein VFQ53_01950, partial [Kofleriaceae bacterium]|nr:hypothetical protein [Kofleriaceae bacterium]
VESELDTIAPPPAELVTRVDALADDVARARVLALAIDPRAIDAAARAATAARELGYLPLAGRAALVHGIALLLQQRRADGITVLDAAMRLALQAGDPTTAVEAVARELYAVASASSPATLPSGVATDDTALELVQAIARGLPDTGAFARALLFNNAGTLQLARQQRTAAARWFEDALRVRPPVAGDTIELATIPGNLALVVDDTARRDRLARQQAEELAAVVGEDHPMTIDARIQIAMFVADPRAAGAQLGDACARYRRMHPHLAERITQCAYEVAWLAEERGDLAAARDAIAATTKQGKEARIAHGLGLLLDGHGPEAARELVALADEVTEQAHYWQRWRSVDALLYAALAEHAAGRRDASRGLLERALSTLSSIEHIARTPFYQRRLARVHLELARLDGPERARHAAAAAAWYRDVPGYETVASEAARLAQ